MDKKKKIPKPGSDEAVEQGCICAILDNHHGEGFPYGDNKGPCFWITDGCPLHAPYTPWWQLKKYGGWKNK